MAYWILAAMLQAAVPAAATATDLIGNAEPVIRARMVDPDSMKLRWPYGWARWKDRSVTCGVVNSKNRMGGYSGDTFVILVNPDKGNPFVNIADSSFGNDGVTGMCEEMIRKGEITAQ